MVQIGDERRLSQQGWLPPQSRGAGSIHTFSCEWCRSTSCRLDGEHRAAADYLDSLIVEGGVIDGHRPTHESVRFHARGPHPRTHRTPLLANLACEYTKDSSAKPRPHARAAPVRSRTGEWRPIRCRTRGSAASVGCHSPRLDSAS